MPAPGIALIVAHPDRKAQRALQRLVGATLCPVQVVAEVDDLIAAMTPTTIAIVDLSLARARPALTQQPARAWIAVPGEGVASADVETVNSLLAAGWTHVVAHGMPLLGEELLATVQKLVRDESFGLEKYMAWGAEVRQYTLDHTQDRGTAVDALAKDIVAVGLPDRVGSLVSVIADELITNALYVAPVDARGVRLHAGAARDTARALTGREGVTVRWATDARYLAVEVRDRFGSLDPQVIAACLVGHAAKGEGGMGLALAYACCNQLVINLAPGVLTEVIALLDVRFKPTELGRSASFHVFVGAAAELAT